MSTSIFSPSPTLVAGTVTPGTRRLRSFFKVLWRSLEAVGRKRAVHAMRDTAAGLALSRPELARELRAASSHLLSH